MFIFMFAACVCLVMAGMENIAIVAADNTATNSTSIPDIGGSFKAAAEGYNVS